MHPGRQHRVQRKTSPQRGQALVEFAFVLPVMLVILLGLIEIGRGFVLGVAAQDGARQAARLAANGRSNPGITDTSIVQRLIDGAAPALAGCSLAGPVTATPVTLAGCGTATWTVTESITPNTGSGAVYSSFAQALASADAANLNGATVEVTVSSPSVALLAGFTTGWGGMRLYQIPVRGDAQMVVL
jgi:Flp pilus assembly protein TadG